MLPLQSPDHLKACRLISVDDADHQDLPTARDIPQPPGDERLALHGVTEDVRLEAGDPVPNIAAPIGARRRYVSRGPERGEGQDEEQARSHPTTVRTESYRNAEPRLTRFS